MGTLRLDADNRKVRREDQDDVDDKQHGGIARKLAVIKLVEHQHDDAAHEHAERLARERIRLAALNGGPYDQKAVCDKQRRHDKKRLGNPVGERALAARRAIGRTGIDRAALGHAHAIDFVKSRHASQPFPRPCPHTGQTA